MQALGGESVTIPEGTSIGSLIVGRPLEGRGDDERYTARQPGLERDVELLVLRRDRLQDVAAAERFQREARLGSRIAHPNVLGVIDYFSLRGDQYLVRDHVAGEALAGILERKAPLPRAIAARIALEIARGLGELHARGVAHGGLQPELVRVSRWGDVKVEGLGRARELSSSGVADPLEPTAFTAPEVARGGSADERSDVYSLGVLLSRMRPGAESRLERALAIGVDRLSQRMCVDDPAKRPPLAAVTRRLARAALDPDPIRVRMELAAWLWQARALRIEHALTPTRRAAAQLVDPAPEPRSAEPDSRARALPDHPEDPPPASLTPDPDPERRPPLAPGSLRPPLSLSGEGSPQPYLPTRSQPDHAAEAGASGHPEVARHRARWLQAPRTRTSALAAVLLALAAPLAWWLSGRGAEAEAPPPISEVAAGGPTTLQVEPARVVFAVHPWAEVEIDGAVRFVSPRASPVELPPGEHEARFRHPLLGEASVRFVVSPGERRIIRHEFAAGAPS